MTPFQEFRMWIRRAPASERVATGVAAAIVLALLAWLLVPGTGGASSEVTSAGPSGGTSNAPSESNATAAAPSGSTGAPGAAPAAGSSSSGGSAAPGSSSAGGGSTGGGAAGSGSSGSPAGGPGCTSPGSAPGVSSSQIKIAVTLTNVVGPAANSVFGIASPDEQKSWYEAQLAAINAAGGVACRKVVAQYFNANPADQNDLQQKCLDIAQAGLFAEVDNGSYANYPQKQCFAQHHIPYFGGYILTRSEVTGFYPYLFNIKEYDTLEHNTILGLKDRGFFSAGNGFKKLGFIYQDCDKGLVDVGTRSIQQAGVPSSQLVTYDVGCPSTFTSPSTLSAAVLKFQQNGVTHLTFSHFVGDFANFSNIAQQQGFRPKYGIPDESVIDIASGSQAPNPSNIANAVAITSGRSGEASTPGITPTPATAKCDAAYQSHGLPPTYKLPAGAGYVCVQLAMFKAAVEHAPALQQSALAAGLQAAKSIDVSYPGGPNDFSRAKVTTGGQFWRAAQFMPSCSCWQVIDRDFHPSYA